MTKPIETPLEDDAAVLCEVYRGKLVDRSRIDLVTVQLPHSTWRKVQAVWYRTMTAPTEPDSSLRDFDNLVKMVRTADQEKAELIAERDQAISEKNLLLAKIEELRSTLMVLLDGLTRVEGKEGENDDRN